MRRKWIPLIVLSASFFGFISCPNPLDRRMLLHVKDSIGPVVTITSPAEGSYCAKTVIVTGTVADSSSAAGDAGKVKSLTYEILATSDSGSVPFGNDGSFSFQFSTSSLSLNFVLKITAEDWNGNTSEKSFTLLKESGDDIPSFTAMPGNQQATLTWGEVPLATSYTLYYTTNGTLPSENYGIKVDAVTSPLILANLTNGSMHVFLLQAHSSSREDNWSGYMKAIPLSPQSLAPRIIGEFRQIRIEWPDIPADVDFEVWRSTEKHGTYLNISGSTANTWLVDTMVQDNQHYYYKIKPSMQGSLESWPNCGQTSPFPIPYSFPLGACATTGAARGVAVSGNYAFMAALGGLHIVDIFNLTSPTLVGYHDTPGSAYDVAVSGNYAYVEDYDRGLQIFNISNPTSPTLAGSYDTPGGAYGMAVNGTRAYVADYTSLQILDISTLPPTPVTNYETAGFAVGVTVNGIYAYVADSSAGGLQIIDISVTPPILAGSYNTPGEAVGVVVDGSFAYVADYSSGLQILDVSNPASIPQAVAIDTPGSARAVAVSGNYVYVADSDAGLQVLNISSPASPTLVDSYDTPGSAYDVLVVGGVAYVADLGSGLRNINILNPASPIQADAYDTPGYAYGVTVSGSFAYVADDTSGLQILNITTLPSTLGGSCDTPGSARGVAVSGDYGYIADDTSGLQIIDITSLPGTIVGSYNTSGNARAVAVSGDYAYVADVASGLQIINIANPAYPTLVGSYNTTGLA